MPESAILGRQPNRTRGTQEAILILDIAIAAALACLVAVATVALYLWWQSRIEPLEYGTAFQVQEAEPVRVARDAGGWLVATADGITPVALQAGSSPTDVGAPHPVVPAAGGYRVAPVHLPHYRAFFRVHLDDGRSIQTAERTLLLAGPANFRDLGGYPAANGRRVAWGRVYRADELHVLTPADAAFLQDLGIRLVCDLRSHAEVARRPDVVPRGIGTVHIPIYAREPFGQARVVFSRHRLDSLLDRLYQVAIIDRGAAALGQALRLAADPANLPLVFHCTGGKDRAGVTSALLLHICGVPRATIIADYSLTNLAADRFLASIRAAIAGSRSVPGFRVEQLYPLLSARPALIERALASIDERHGSLDAYLRGPAGLSEGEIEAIRRNLLI